jgi:F0F1-type ATP synthase membrane subunit b/b'
MATREPERSGPTGSLTSLPRIEDLAVVEQGFDQDKVREAFDAFRRHTLQLQAQLRVLQAAGTSAQVEPTGHAVRMDALHLIRAAAEFADSLERDAQSASAAQMRRTQEEVRRRQREAQEREAEVEKFRKDSESQRAEILSAARTEARELLTKATQDATRELQEAEARGARLLEQSRHQATELTNSARAEVEQTLEWARAQAGSIMTRTQTAAEQLLAAAGLGSKQMATVVEAILRSVERDEEDAVEAAKPQAQQPLVQVAEPEPAAEAEPVAEESTETTDEPEASEPAQDAGEDESSSDDEPER